jgi:membrane-associated protease RseP (regulator of RpoE activity)
MVKNIIIVVLLLSISIGGVFASSTINLLKSTITTLQIKHKKAIVKTKIKERGKRVLAAIPIVGLIAVAWFEKLEYEEWHQDNPDGTPEQYSKEMADLVYEMADEYYEEINKTSSNSNLPVDGETNNVSAAH